MIIDRLLRSARADTNVFGEGIFAPTEHAFEFSTTEESTVLGLDSLGSGFDVCKLDECDPLGGTEIDIDWGDIRELLEETLDIDTLCNTNNMKEFAGPTELLIDDDLFGYRRLIVFVIICRLLGSNRWDLDLVV